MDFKNTIIILTSNLGSPYILDGITEDGDISDEAREQVDRLLKTSFRPEFLNRLDEIVYYKPLRRQEIRGIVDLMLAELSKRLADKQLTIEVTDRAKDAVIEQGFDPSYGARPLKRFIQRKVETLVAKKIIAGEVTSEKPIVVDVENGEFKVN